MNQVNPYAPPTADPTPNFNPELGPNERPLATRGSRLAASFLDGLIMLVVIIPIQYMLGFFDNFPNMAPSFSDQFIGVMLGVLTYALINGKFLAESGQTIGKKAMGIKITNMDGSQPSMLEVVLKRYSPMALLGLVPLLNLINILMIFGGSKRCGHDLIAGTKVVVA